MIKDKDLKAYDFQDITEYFEYIVESRTNGQRKQAKDLYASLSEAQKESFKDWFYVWNHYDIADDNEIAVQNEFYKLFHYLTA